MQVESVVGSREVHAALPLKWEPRKKITYRILALAACVGIAVLPFIEIDVHHRSSAVARTLVQQVEIRSLSAGVVRKLLIAQNQEVKANDLLVELNDEAIRAEIQSADSELDEHQRWLSDFAILSVNITRLAQSIDGDRSFDPDNLPELIQQHLASAQLSSYAQKAELARLEKEIGGQGVNLTNAYRELSQAKTLAAKGMISARDSSAALEKWRGAVLSLAVLLQRQASQWATESREREIKAASLSAHRQMLLDRLESLKIRAPCDGTILQVAALGPGVNVLAGGQLCTLTPKSPLIFEAYIEPRNIAHVQVDQRAILQLDALPYAQWGTIEAKVVSISPDAIAESNLPLFRVILEPQSTSLTMNGHTAQVVAGMSATARFFTERASALRLLLDGVSKHLDPRSPYNPSAAIPRPTNKKTNATSTR